MVNQITNGVGLTELVNFLDLNNDVITATIARDTIRAACIEYTDSSLVVHRLTKNINNNNRNTLTEMYSNINKQSFITDMETKKWSFEQIYIDHYCMSPSKYVSTYGNGFFQNIIRMAKSTVLKRDMNGSPTAYLPFVPHLFIHLNFNKPIKELYNITYIRKI